MTNRMGDRLYELRTKHDMNQEQLADKLGVSRQAVSKWERGESQPDTNNLIALSDLYNVTIDYLVKGEETKKTPTVVSSSTNDSSKQAAVSHENQCEFSAPKEADRITFSDPSLNAAPAGQPPSTPPSYDHQAPSSLGGQQQSQPQPQQTATTLPSHTATKKRSPMKTFPYPILIVLIFLTCGFVFHAWNPAWVLFFTIPFYYWIVSVIEHDPGDDDC